MMAGNLQGTIDNQRLKISTIGSGSTGSTMGTLWAKAGHPVLFSSRQFKFLEK